jgi:hypothetical protein
MEDKDLTQLQRERNRPKRSRTKNVAKQQKEQIQAKKKLAKDMARRQFIGRVSQFIARPIILIAIGLATLIALFFLAKESFLKDVINPPLDRKALIAQLPPVNLAVAKRLKAPADKPQIVEQKQRFVLRYQIPSQTLNFNGEKITNACRATVIVDRIRSTNSQLVFSITRALPCT